MDGKAPDPTETQGTRTLDDPRLLAYLPMLYVAWADGDLSADETRAICSRVTGPDGPGRGCSDLLGEWLDPQLPPSATELRSLLRTIRRGAAELSVDQKGSLTDLGVELARAGGRKIEASERQALVEIEEAVGVTSSEAARVLLFPERPTAPEAEDAVPFDSAALLALLDGQEAETRRRVREILRRPQFRYEYGLDRHAYREKVLEWTRALADEGLGALPYPAADGGAEDMAKFVATFETLAFGDLSLLIKFGVQFGLFTGSIAQLGTDRHHRRYIGEAVRLELPGCFAMTETGHGSNVADLETTARYLPESDEFEIHTPHEGACKDYIGNAAAHGRLATVFAQLEIDHESQGVHAFLVPIRDTQGEALSGVRIADDGEKLGLNGVDNGRLWFDHVRIPRENLLDRFAAVDAEGVYSSPIASPAKRFFTMLGTLVGGRVNVALAALSASKSALTIAVRYGAARRQFGPAGQAEQSILDYLTHQRRLLPRLATVYGLHFALRWLGRRFVAEDGDRREIESLAAGLKAFATWHTTETIQTCREACGGQGYLAENRFAALKADTDVFTTFEGDNTVLLQLAAKGLLTGYKKQFGEMGAVGLLRYVAGHAKQMVSELNPVVTRMTGEDHLRDREFQISALRWREAHLLSTLARRLQARIAGGMDSFAALIECQDHAITLAKANVESIVLERFSEAVEQIDDEGIREALTLLCDLFALWRIELDMAWFLEHGVVEPGKAKAIRKLNNKLILQVRPLALGLVDAFGIPAELLAAPIGLGSRSTAR